MSLQPDNFDELLNAKLDDELSAEERSQLDQVLEQNETARNDFESLQEMSSLLKDHFKESSASTELPPSFSAGVLAACEAAKSAEPTLVPASSDAAGHREVGTKLWIFAAAIAASVALAVFLPGFLAPKDGPQLGQSETVDQEPTTTIVSNDPESPFDSSPGTESDPETKPEIPTIGDPSAQVEYVSEMQFPAIMYLLEVDIEATEEALKNKKIEAILKKHGIDPKEPLAVNDQVQGMIEQARMNVGQSGQATDAYVHLVRAPIRSLGAALDEIYGDRVSFPNVKFALGFDTPNVGLFKTLLKNSGTRFVSNESFMAPIASADSNHASPFRGIGSEGKLVSAAKREKGFGQLNMLTMDPSQGEELENLILFVRLPQ